MKSRLSIAVVLLVTLVVAAAGQKAKSEAYVKDEVLVKYTDGTASVSARNANDRLGSTELEKLGGDGGWGRVRLREGLSVKDAIAKYSEMPGVAYAQPNFYYHLLATPNDPSFTSSGMYGLTKIGAPSAWDLSTGSSSVVVADIDTGMRYTHQDLAPNAWVNPGEIAGNGVDDDGNGFVDDVYGWDFFYNDSDPIDDAGGHGTHTAGTIGAAGNNGLNVVGVNWTVKLMPIKIYSPNGTDSTSSMLVNAYAYIRMMKLRGVNIVATNNSYGDCGEACGYDQATKDGIDAMGEAGIISVYAAGNDNQNVDSFPAGGNPAPGYPARYTSPSIIAVAASDPSDVRASFSNYGVTSIDLAAPGGGNGSSVLSTCNTSNTATCSKQGTSMATPHVTGAVALLAAYRPDLSAASIKASLLNNVDVLANWNGLVKTGGRLNIFKAMQTPTVCTFVPSQSSMQVPTKGGVFTINVTAANNCDYLVRADTSWVKMMSADTQSGNGSFTFRVGVNPTIHRTGTITFGGQTFTITQKRD